MLEKLDITPVETPEPDLTYIFKHIITQEVTYNLMAFAQRRKLHQTVAQWYEKTYQDDLAIHYPLLVHHWQNAENTAKTITYLEKAGEQALQNSAYQEAIGFFNQALQLDSQPNLATDDYRRARWTLKLGNSYWGWGRFLEALPSLEEAATLYGDEVPHTSGRLIVALLRQIGLQVRHRLQPNRYMGRVSTNERPLYLQKATLYHQLLSIYFFANEKIKKPLWQRTNAQYCRTSRYIL